jgi:hypothetical protein
MFKNKLFHLIILITYLLILVGCKPKLANQINSHPIEIKR